MSIDSRPTQPIHPFTRKGRLETLAQDPGPIHSLHVPLRPRILGQTPTLGRRRLHSFLTPTSIPRVNDIRHDEWPTPAVREHPYPEDRLGIFVRAQHRVRHLHPLHDIRAHTHDVCTPRAQEQRHPAPKQQLHRGASPCAPCLEFPPRPIERPRRPLRASHHSRGLFGVRDLPAHEPLQHLRHAPHELVLRATRP